MKIYIDFETYSDVDIRKAGAWAYSSCPQCKVLMMAWVFDNDPVIRMWTPPDPLPDWCSHPNDYTIIAHNAEFEYAIWNNVLSVAYGLPKLLPATVNCTAARSTACGLPRSLEDTAKALKVGIQKHPAGQRYIRLFCCPKVTQSGAIARGGAPVIFPAEWAEFKLYCIQDVGAMRESEKLLPELIPSEQEAFQTHLRINERGIYCDRASVDLLDNLCTRAETYMKSTEYGGMLGSPTKLIPLLSMLGVEVKDCRQDTLERALADPDASYAAKELIGERLDYAKSSVKKFKRMQIADNGDHRLRGMHIFNGAHTGRFSGAIVQLQNLPRACVRNPEAAVRELHKMPDSLDDTIACYGGPGQLLKHASRMVRPMLRAAPGYEFIVFDFTAIEAVNTYWLTNAEHMLSLYHNSYDAYRYMAAQIFGVGTYEDDSLERFVGKQTVLGCNYGLGWRKFIVHCLVIGKITVDELLAKNAVNTYRSTVPQVPAGWAALDETVTALFRLHGTGAFEMFGGKLAMWIVWDGMQAQCLCCRLPSGRIMRWHFPSYVQVPSADAGRRDEMMLTYLTHRKQQTKGQAVIQNVIRERCSARGLDADPYLGRVPPALEGWSRVTIWGGKFMENIIQAISRDVLVAAQVRCEKYGFPVVLHAHDENVFEVRKEIAADAFDELKVLSVERESWMKGMFVGVKGWRGTYYKK